MSLHFTTLARLNQVSGLPRPLLPNVRHVELLKPSILALSLSLTLSLSFLDITYVTLDASSLAKLAQAQGLTRLKISIMHATDATFHSATHMVSFPPLNDVTIRTDSTSTCSKAFLLLSAPQVSNLSLLVWIGEESSFSSIFAALHQRGSHNKLETITFARILTNYEEEEEDWSTPLTSEFSTSFSIDNEALHALSSFGELENLSVAPWNTSRVNDDAFHVFLSGCTKLKMLHIRDDYMDENVPLLTFGGLHSALQNSPLLEELALRFKALDRPSDHIMILPPTEGSYALPGLLRRFNGGIKPERYRATSNLGFLDVCTSPLGIPGIFRQWLACHHPGIQDIKYFEPFRQGSVGQDLRHLSST